MPIIYVEFTVSFNLKLWWKFTKTDNGIWITVDATYGSL